MQSVTTALQYLVWVTTLLHIQEGVFLIRNRLFWALPHFKMSQNVASC